jgi:hypothetical protein
MLVEQKSQIKFSWIVDEIRFMVQFDINQRFIGMSKSLGHKKIVVSSGGAAISPYHNNLEMNIFIYLFFYH